MGAGADVLHGVKPATFGEALDVTKQGAKEALGTLRSPGDITLKGVAKGAKSAAAGGALLGAGGLAAWGAGDIAAGLLTDREHELAERVSRLGDKTTTAVGAAFQQEADQGGAWADPMWPFRLHGMLTRQGERPQWAADAGIPVRSSASDYTAEELRTGWIAWLYGHQGPGISQPLDARQRAAVDRYLREQASKRRPRSTSRVDEATPGDEATPSLYP